MPEYRKRHKWEPVPGTPQLPFDKVESMTPMEEQVFWTALENRLSNDDGAAAKEHLAAGRSIVYGDDRFPDALVREWPDGRRELIEVDENRNVTVLRTLCDRSFG